MATTQQVQALYIGLLGRAADQAGLNFWIQDIASGNRTLNDVQKEFAASPEFATTYGSLAGDRTALVSAIYSNLFERAPDAAGLAYWVGTSLSADELIASFIQYASPADRTVLTNKTLVAEIYTSVAGGAATFNVADAAKVVADVNGTSASVATAVGGINTLPGVVTPTTINAIKALEAAVASQTAYETNKANVDALVALQAKVVALDTKSGAAFVPAVPVDGSDADSVAGNNVNELLPLVLTNANSLRTSISALETNVLQANADNTAAALASSKQALVLTLANGAALVSAYESAAAAAAAAQPPAAAAKTAALADLGGLQAAQDTAWDAAIAASGVAGLNATSTAGDVYAVLAAAATTDASITALKNAFAASGLNDIAKTAFTAAANLAAVERADTQATDKETAALTALTNAATTQGGTAPAAVGDYTGKAGANATAQATLANAKEADALKVEAAALAASYKAVTDAVTNANTAVTAAGPIDVDANKAGAATAEVFYFADKAAATDDFTVGFTKGDSLYVGSGLTFNSGALSTGNNNALEFFLVKNGVNTNVVIETKAFGSATTTVAADGSVTASPDDVAVITLTGVTLEQLSVNNGVVTWA